MRALGQAPKRVNFAGNTLFLRVKGEVVREGGQYFGELVIFTKAVKRKGVCIVNLGCVCSLAATPRQRRQNAPLASLFAPDRRSKKLAAGPFFLAGRGSGPNYKQSLAKAKPALCYTIRRKIRTVNSSPVSVTSIRASCRSHSSRILASPAPSPLTKSRFR